MNKFEYKTNYYPDSLSLDTASIALRVASEIGSGENKNYLKILKETIALHFLQTLFLGESKISEEVGAELKMKYNGQFQMNNDQDFLRFLAMMEGDYKDYKEQNNGFFSAFIKNLKNIQESLGKEKIAIVEKIENLENSLVQVPEDKEITDAKNILTELREALNVEDTRDLPLSTIMMIINSVDLFIKSLQVKNEILEGRTLIDETLNPDASYNSGYAWQLHREMIEANKNDEYKSKINVMNNRSIFVEGVELSGNNLFSFALDKDLIKMTHLKSNEEYIFPARNLLKINKSLIYDNDWQTVLINQEKQSERGVYILLDRLMTDKGNYGFVSDGGFYISLPLNIDYSYRNNQLILTQEGKTIAGILHFSGQDKRLLITNYQSKIIRIISLKNFDEIQRAIDEYGQEQDVLVDMKKNRKIISIGEHETFETEANDNSAIGHREIDSRPVIKQPDDFPKQENLEQNNKLYFDDTLE